MEFYKANKQKISFRTPFEEEETLNFDGDWFAWGVAKKPSLSIARSLLAPGNARRSLLVK